jgi:hypothetical protein
MNGSINYSPLRETIININAIKITRLRLRPVKQKRFGSARVGTQFGLK